MNPEKPRLELMRRTMRNLEFIEQHRDLQKGPYEVTQLVNSFLGALAHPWEDLRDDLKTWSLDEARARGWPFPHDQSGENPRTLGRLLGLVRNAFAHGNVAFHGPKDGEIETVVIWNKEPRSGEETWRGTFNVHDLRQFLACFVQLAEQLQTRDSLPETRRHGAAVS